MTMNKSVGTNRPFQEDDNCLQIPECISLLISYLNLSIPRRFTVNNNSSTEFAQEYNKLKDSGNCSKITSSFNYPAESLDSSVNPNIISASFF